MDDSQPDATAPSGGAGARSCGECGSVLRAGAEFCTDCGASANPPADGVGGPMAGECPECGTGLRTGAAFCTECGASSAAPTLITAGAPPSGAAAAALLSEVRAGAHRGTATAIEEPPTAAPSAAPDRKTGPAASRTILASVGATGGYSSTRIAGTARPAPPGASPPSAIDAAGSSPDDGSKRKVLALVAVAVVVLVAIVAVITAGGSHHQDKVVAGPSGGLDSSRLTSHQVPTTAGSNGSGSSPTTSKGHKSSKHGSTHSGATVTAAPTTSKPGSTPHHTTGTTTTGATPPTTHRTPPPIVVPPPSQPPPTKGAAPGRLSVATSSISLTGSSRSYPLTISNTGGSALKWDSGIGGLPNNSISPNRGQVSPGQSQTVTVSWNPAGSAEGQSGGWLVISASTTETANISLYGDTRQVDLINQGGWYSGAHCAAGSSIDFAVHFQASGGATPSLLNHVEVRLAATGEGFGNLTSRGLAAPPGADPHQNWSATLPHAVSGGILDFIVTAIDKAGNTATTEFRFGC